MKRWITVVVLSLAASTMLMAAGDAKAGKADYDKACKSCHGPDGTHNASIAKMMKVEMQDLSSKEVQAMSDADLKKVIAEGKGKMKAIKSLDDKQAGDVVAFVRTLKK